jgi:hypothetical protein
MKCRMCADCTDGTEATERIDKQTTVALHGVSQDVPTDPGFLYHKAAVFEHTIKGTICTWPASQPHVTTCVSECLFLAAFYIG